jgi:hypothetical protein
MIKSSLKNNPQVEKKPVISKDTALRNVVEWLYVNDHNFPSREEWRTKFLEMIEFNIKSL